METDKKKDLREKIMSFFSPNLSKKPHQASAAIQSQKPGMSQEMAHHIHSQLKGAIEQKEGIIGIEAVEIELERISQERYLSPEKINNLLQSLPGVKASLPADEIKRLRSLLPRELSPQMIAEMEKLKNATEDQAPLLIQQTPAIFIANGKKFPFSLQNFKYEIWDKSCEHDSSLPEMYIDENFVTTGQHIWEGGKLQVHTSRCLKGTKNKDFNTQLQHKKSILGPGYKTDEQIFFAILFRYLGSERKDKVMLDDYMRIHIADILGYPLSVYTRVNSFCLSSPLFYTMDGMGSSFETDSDGLGASLEIS